MPPGIGLCAVSLLGSFFACALTLWCSVSKKSTFEIYLLCNIHIKYRMFGFAKAAVFLGYYRLVRLRMIPHSAALGIQFVALPNSHISQWEKTGSCLFFLSFKTFWMPPAAGVGFCSVSPLGSFDAFTWII